MQLDYDPFAANVMRDPQPYYRMLRDHAPVYRLDQYDGWALSRFQDVYDTFLDREHFTESEGQVFQLETLATSHHGAQPPRASADPLSLFNFLDPPLQTRIRRVMAGPLHPAAIARQEEFVRLLTRRTLDRLVAQGSFDGNTDFASFISCSAVCQVIGLPGTDIPWMVNLVNRTVARDPGQPGFTAAGMEAGGKIFEYIADCVRRRRARQIDSPCPLIDSLMDSDLLGRPLTDAEITMQVQSILIGGTESLPKIIAGGLVELAQHPDQRAYVAADASRCAAAVEEMIRYHAPAQWFGRTLTCDLEVAGTPMRTGQRVFLLVGSANRDEREFEDPDTFRCDRTMRRVVAFGVGPHFCSGVFLARLEARIMIQEFLARIEHYEVDLSHAERSVSEFQIGWTNLPVRIVSLKA